jgi:N-acetylmuramoyl-L-alanine amidase
MATKPTNTQPQIVPPSREKKGGLPASDSREALQALLAFSTLHDQIRQRRAEDAKRYAAGMSAADNPWATEQFMLDEVLQLVAERAQAITGSDGIAIALAEGDEIICRASVGSMAPDRGMRLNPRSGFSGACMRARRIIRCDDSENDPRVDVLACRQLGTRSMVAVPLLGHDSVIGLLEAFSTEPFGFSDQDVRNLSLLAELILAALKPEDEERIVQAAKVAAAEFDAADIDDLRRIPLIHAEVLPPALAAPGELPLELSKENIAPPLFEGSTPSTFRQKFFLVAALVIAAASIAGLWWKFRTARSLPAAVAAPSPKIAAPKPSAATSSAAATTGATLSKSSADTQPATAPSSELAEGAAPSVTGIRHWSENGVTSVTIDLQSEVQYETHRLDNPDRIYFDLHDTALASSLNVRSIDVSDNLLTRIRVAQPVDGITRVVLDTKAVSDFSVRMEQNPYRLVIEVRPRVLQTTPQKSEPASAQPAPAQSAPAQPAAQPKTQPAPPAHAPATQQTVPAPAPTVASQPPAPKSEAKTEVKSNAKPDVKPAVVAAASIPTAPVAKNVPAPNPPAPQPDTRAQTSKLRIVIDAGHGGWDLGTVGRHGLLEKDLVLDVAQRLGVLIETRLGGEVIFTRHDDKYLSLEQRAELANRAQADFFVSVHANYSDLASARGVETYYSSFFLPPEAREAELRGTGQPQPVSQAKLSSAELKEKVNGSRKLAADVQRALYDSLSATNNGIRNRGVREASYVVLTGTEMPSILAEISFVSSPADEERLKSAAYREQIAEALYAGIAQYQAGRHPLKLAAASGHPTGQ